MLRQNIKIPNNQFGFMQSNQGQWLFMCFVLYSDFEMEVEILHMVFIELEKTMIR